MCNSKERSVRIVGKCVSKKIRKKEKKEWYVKDGSKQSLVLKRSTSPIFNYRRTIKNILGERG